MQLSRFVYIITFLACPSMAQDQVQFRTADDNIHCLIVPGDFADVRCDIDDFTPSFTIAPLGCDLDWEGSFIIGADQPRGELGCVGDTIVDPFSRVIKDGATISRGNFSCVAAQSDLTCVNLDGHGFTLTRARQSLF